MNVIKQCKYGLMVYNRKDIWQGRSFEIYGEYSESEVKLFADVIKPGHCVLDVGANIGSHTLSFARIVGPQGLVVAFEPERNNFYTLCANVAVNNLRNVFCFQQAIGNEVGSINVPEIDYDKTDNFGGLELDHDYSKTTHYPVVLNTLDSITLGDVNFIKVDVEGMELKVLKGAIATINQHKSLLYVENDRKDKAEELIGFIRNLGYEIYEHMPPLFNQNNYYEEKENVFGNVCSINLFCHRKEMECPVDPNRHGLKIV